MHPIASTLRKARMHPIPLPTNPESLSDEELLVRARLRDERAVRAITLRYNRRLYRVARGILRNDSEAEDVVQETYFRAFTRLDLFRGEAAFGTWLTRIAINDALGRLRRRRPTVDWESHGENRIQAEIIQFPGLAAANDPERTMARSEIRDVLEHAIDDLPDLFRVVFVARVIEGMNVEETAELLGLQPETVKTRLHRARLLLRATLEEQLGPALTETFPFGGRRCQRTTELVVRRVCALAK
jgi:RNA polymerase sigma-70 factor, ECF subfamily